MEINTLIWVLLGVLAVIGIAGIFQGKKKVLGITSGRIFGAVCLIGSIFLFATQMGYLAGLGLAPFSAGIIAEGAEEVQTSGICAVEDTTVTLSASDSFLSTAVGGSHRYRINGNPALTVADAGTFTASPGDKLTILWMNGTTGTYFSEVSTVTVPCKGTYSPSDITLVKNGSLTSRIYDTDGDLMDGLVNNQTLSAGDVKSVKMELEGAYQRGFPYGFVMVVEYNKTSIDDVIIADRASAVELTAEGVPQTYSATYATDSVKKAYLVSEMNSNAIKELTVTVDADDSQAPGVDTSDVLFTYYPRNYFINDKNGGAFEGPSAEDEYNTLTRAGGISAILYVE